MNTRQICLYAPYIGICTALGVAIGDAITHGTHGLAILPVLAIINGTICWYAEIKQKRHFYD